MMRRLLAMAPAAALLVSVSVVELPLFALSPGPAKDVFPLIKIAGVETTDPNGSLLLTTVNVRRADLVSAIRGWLDPAVEVVREERIIPPGQTEEEYDEITRSQMDESKIAAAVAVLERLTDYPQEHGRGVLVQDVVGGSAADGRLFPGDLIRSIDDEEVQSVEQVSRAIDRTEGRRGLALVVEAEGEERRVRVRPSIPEGEEDPLLGVVLVESFPFELTIESGDIGGPSAGLMWALGLYDLLSDRDLAAGRRIAGTGTITLSGAVGAIGGVEEKVRAAEHEGAELFLVPEGNTADARAVAGEIRIVTVQSLPEAVRFLTRSANQAA